MKIYFAFFKSSAIWNKNIHKQLVYFNNIFVISICCILLYCYLVISFFIITVLFIVVFCLLSSIICSTVNQVSKNLCFILMVQAYGSIDFDGLFVFISTLTLSPDFTFCRVELRYTRYPLDVTLLSNGYILLTCYDTEKLVLLKISVIRFPKQ